MHLLIALLITGGMMTDSPEGLGNARIGQVALTVTDIETTRQFYEDRLGLPLQVAMANMLIFDCSGTTLLLSLPEGEEKRIGGGTVVYLQVDDARTSSAQLKERGVDFIDAPHVVHRTNEAELWMTFFRDPDGNLLALMSWSGRAG
jgi:methylmalonyl-CoA/ethylmalonyl-CoA epimerase